MTNTEHAGAQAPAAGPTGRLASTADMPPGRLRAVARGDLRDLHAWGHLTRRETPGHLSYTLTTRKDVRL